uniref:Uncharacterized protein n=1 Tax=Arundo donax TaxID=35708 RepID=A0A0A8ZUV6_ARUDO
MCFSGMKLFILVSQQQNGIVCTIGANVIHLVLTMHLELVSHWSVKNGTIC